MRAREREAALTVSIMVTGDSHQSHHKLTFAMMT
jgi:hypothetical protein